MPLWAWGVAGLLLGAIAGSYIATVLIRWPQGQAARGRSRCDHCNVVLRPLDLVPLLSFLLRRGRCAHCGATIDPRHPLLEGAAALIGALSLLLVPGPPGLAGALFGWLLLALAALDAEHYWLPNRMTGLLAALGLAAGLLGLQPPLAERLIGGIAGFAALAAIALGYRLLRGRDGMGGGDPKLLGGIGLWLGWQALPLVVLLASFCGLALLAVHWLSGKAVHRAQEVPFGALLAVVSWPLWLASTALR